MASDVKWKKDIGEERGKHNKQMICKYITLIIKNLMNRQKLYSSFRPVSEPVSFKVKLNYLRFLDKKLHHTAQN